MLIQKVCYGHFLQFNFMNTNDKCADLRTVKGPGSIFIVAVSAYRQSSFPGLYGKGRKLMIRMAGTLPSG